MGGAVYKNCLLFLFWPHFLWRWMLVISLNIFTLAKDISIFYTLPSAIFRIFSFNVIIFIFLADQGGG